MPKDYKRTDRIAEQLQRELSILIQREVQDPNLGLVTVTAVKVASDLSIAKVYITQLDDNRPMAHTLKILNKMTKFLRFQLAKAVELRAIPQLKFIHDISVNEGIRLASLIEKAISEDEKKQHDTEN